MKLWYNISNERGDFMILKSINFKLDKLYLESQSISFTKDKHCYIGANGSGKTTLLKAVHKVFNRRNLNGMPFFKIEDSYVDYIVEEDSPIRNMLNTNPKEELKVQMRFKDYEKYFICPWIKDEYSFLRRKILSSYDSFIFQIKKTRELFDEFAIEKGIDSSRFSVSYENFISNNHYHLGLNQIEAEEIDGKIYGRGSTKELYRLRKPKYLVAKNGGNLPVHYDFAENLFDRFKVEGKATHQIYIKEFDEKYNHLVKDIGKSIELFNGFVDKFNNVFGQYSNLYMVLKNNSISNVELLSYESNSKPDKIIFSLALRCISNVYYEKLAKSLIRDLKREINDFNFYDDLRKLNVLHSELNNFNKSNFDSSFINNENAMSIYTNDLPYLKDRLKRVLKNRDLVHDFSTLMKDFNMNLDIFYIYELVEKVLLPVMMRYDDNITDSTQIDFSIGSNEIKSITLSQGKSIRVSDLSSGTNWGIRFELIKKIIGESDLLLIDEPALFLHQFKQREILNQILNMSCKVLYSTHTAALLPVNLHQISLNEVVRKGNKVEIRKVDNNLEKSIIDAFGLKYLQGLLVDFKKQVIFVHPQSDYFNKICSQYGLKQDIHVISGIIHRNSFEKLKNILDSLDIEIITISQKKKRLETLQEQFKDARIYFINDFIEVAKNGNYKSLSEFFVRGDEQN